MDCHVTNLNLLAGDQLVTFSSRCPTAFPVVLPQPGPLYKKEMEKKVNLLPKQISLGVKTSGLSPAVHGRLFSFVA